jgi:hypothetical protein
VKFPDNLHSPELINAAIDKAVQFKWPFNPNEAIRGSGGDDLGLVDYTRLSFYLFGYRIQSLYVLYFVILSISVTSFLWAFRAQPGFLLLAATACAAQVLLFASSLFDRSNLGTVADPRFLRVLAIIPGMHLACLIISKSRPTPINIGLAVLQSVILIFAFWRCLPRCRCSPLQPPYGKSYNVASVSVRSGAGELFSASGRCKHSWS